jgi:ribonuclease E
MAEPNKMLIDATHPEETRVVVLRGGRVEEFDYESAARKQLRGNIYLAKVTRVEPSLQAAFVDYGGNRHGFLAFNEIHPDYYQIPVADRIALIEEEAAAEAAEEAAAEARAEARARREAARAAQRPHAGKKSESGERRSNDRDDEDDDEGDDDIATIEGGAEGTVEDYGDAEDDDRGEDEADATRAEAVGLAEPTLSEPAPESASGDGGEPHHDAPVDAHEAPHDREHSGEVHDGHEHHDHDHDHDHHHHADAGEPSGAAANDDASGARSSASHGDGNGNGNGEPDESVEQVGSEDALEELPSRPRRRQRNYKIQEVIKRRQVILVQVVKEERGNKGAALTTYLSLAGRYTVLMPNTARGGGISRKITQPQDRKRLKAIAAELEVPEGMGLIIRTAGAARTKQEIKRDFEYLLRLWESVRDLTLQSTAPSLVYEEGNLIKRSIRDLYNKDVEEVVVAGDEAFVEARDFMRMLLPSHAKNVIHYSAPEPLFTRYQIERQLNAMFSPYVTLRSGGYLVINQTEALVAIDVNSGKSTREFSIEETALNTNLEASDEIARQLKLRDLAGLIVIDFIDMEEKRNNRNVERRLKDALRFDRARIQVGRISHFGLMEMSRQRLRTGVLEGSTSQCPHCQGTGIIRSVESVALAVLRGLEDAVMAGHKASLTAVTTPTVALYILNKKRVFINDMEARHGQPILVEGSDKMQGANFSIEKGPATALVQRRAERTAVNMDWGFDDDDNGGDADLIDDIADEAPERETRDAREPRGEVRSERGERSERSDRGEREERDSDGRRRRRRRRRGRRGERGERDVIGAEGNDNGDVRDIDDDGDEAADETYAVETIAGSHGEEAGVDADGSESDEAEGADARADGEGDGNGEQAKRRRRRGRRGGRRNRDRQDRAPGSAAAGEEGDADAEGDADTGDDGADGDRSPAIPAERPADHGTADEVHAEASDALAETPAEIPAPAEPTNSQLAVELIAAPAPRPRRSREPAAARAAAEPESRQPAASQEPAAMPADAIDDTAPLEEPGTAVETTRSPRGEPEVSAPRVEHVVVTPDHGAESTASDSTTADAAQARKGWWQRRFGA